MGLGATYLSVDLPYGIRTDRSLCAHPSFSHWLRAFITFLPFQSLLTRSNWNVIISYLFIFFCPYRLFAGSRILILFSDVALFFCAEQRCLFSHTHTKQIRMCLLYARTINMFIISDSLTIYLFYFNSGVGCCIFCCAQIAATKYLHNVLMLLIFLEPKCNII